MKQVKNSFSGFTLIEILTALAITGILVGVIASLLFASFQVTRVLDARKNAVLEKTLIGIERMAKEFETSPVCPSVPFEGQENALSFPKLVSLSGLSALNTEFRLGQVQNVVLGETFGFRKVEYSFDSSGRALLRKAESEKDQVILDHVPDVRFSYLIFPLDKSVGEWKGKTPEAGTEARLGAVRATVRFDPKELSYTIPGVERTFFVFRRHPLNNMEPKGE